VLRLLAGILVAAWSVLVSVPALAGPGSAAQPGEDPPAPQSSTSTSTSTSTATSTGAQEPVAADGEVIEVEGEAPLQPGTATERFVDGETLAQASRRSADDLLRLVPGLHISQHASEGKAQQFFLRGFDAVHGSDLELKVAGIAINEPSNVHGHGYIDVGFVIPEVVSALRARKGSFDLSQGPFAMAGTAELDLGVVAPLRGQRVTYEAGTTNRHRLLALAAPRDLPEQTFAAVEAVSDDGFGTNRESRRVGALSQARIELGRWGRSIDVLAGGYAARFGEPGTLPLEDFESGQVDFYDSYDPVSFGRSYRALSAVRFQDEGDRQRVAASAWAMWRDLTLSENFTGYLVNPDEGDRRTQRHSATTVGTDVELRRDITDHLALVGGAGARGDLIDQHEDQVAETGDRRLQRHSALTLGTDVDIRRDVGERLAVFGGGGARADLFDQHEDQLDQAGNPWQLNRQLDATQGSAFALLGARAGLGPRLRLEGGARLDAVWIGADDRLDQMPSASRSAAVVSPRASLAWRLMPATWLHAAYGRGLRPPEARSITRPTEPPPETDVTQFDGGQPHFTTSDAVEVGGRTRLGDLSLGAGLFGIWIANEMVFDHMTGVNLARNATRRLGGEIDVQLEPAPWLTIRGDLSAVDARFVESGAPVPSAPRLLATAEAYARHHSGWRAGGHLTFLAARPLAHGAVSGAQAVVDLVGSYRFARWEVGLQVDNALAQKWREGEFHFASQFDRGQPASMLPRLHYAAGRPFGVRASLTAWF
jgi:iron complex outermembrane recepter protein